MTTEERLERLERELSRAKGRPDVHRGWLLAGAALCLGIALVAWAFGPGTARAQPAGAALKEVRANRFVLEGENGKTRAMLSTRKDGSHLVLYDEKGRARVRLDVDKSGPGLRLFDDEEKIAWSTSTIPVRSSKIDPITRKKLMTRINQLDFVGAAFGDSIEFLRTVSGANIHVNWRALEGHGIDETTEVKNVKLKDVTVAKALQVLLEDVAPPTDELGFVVEEGVVTISTKAALDKKTSK